MHNRQHVIPDLKSLDLINKKIVESNILQSASPDPMKRKEQLLKKNYYR
jgi:hypothetical protein